MPAIPKQGPIDAKTKNLANSQWGNRTTFDNETHRGFNVNHKTAGTISFMQHKGTGDISIKHNGKLIHDGIKDSKQASLHLANYIGKLGSNPQSNAQSIGSEARFDANKGVNKADKYFNSLKKARVDEGKSVVDKISARNARNMFTNKYGRHLSDEGVHLGVKFPGESDKDRHTKVLNKLKSMKKPKLPVPTQSPIDKNEIKKSTQYFKSLKKSLMEKTNV